MASEVTASEVTASEVIPYSALHKSCTLLLFGRVPFTARLCRADPRFCVVSVPGEFTMQDTHSPCPGRVAVGSSFVVEYEGRQCSVRVGRPITVRDG